MKLFAIIFAAMLLAGLVLWAIITNTQASEARRATLEASVTKSIALTDQLTVLAKTQRPYDLKTADMGIETLRMLARNEELSEYLRKEAAKSADEYEAELKKWR